MSESAGELTVCGETAEKPVKFVILMVTVLHRVFLAAQTPKDSEKTHNSTAGDQP